jgi:hypothetical protein
MTAKEALISAERLLGPLAFVSTGKCRLIYTRRDGRVLCSGLGAHPQPCKGGKPLFEVGRYELNSFHSSQGCGCTWSQAFARARFKLHTDTCKRRWVRQLCRNCEKLRQELHTAVGV